MGDILISILGVLLGGLITWLVAFGYYRKAAVQLRDEAKDLRKLATMILRWLEKRGQNINLVRDKEGNVKGLAITEELTEKVTASDAMTASDTPGDRTQSAPPKKSG